MNKYCYWSNNKLAQDTRLNGNPNQEARKLYGYKDQYPQITSDFPIFDIRSALAVYHYWRTDWPLTMRTDITKRIIEEILSNTVNSVGIPQYIQIQQYQSGIADQSGFVYCGRPKNYQLQSKINFHLGNPFSTKGFPDTIEVTTLRQSIEYYYLWITGSCTIECLDIHKRKILLSTIEPERRAYIQQLLPWLYMSTYSLGCWCYDETQCHTMAIRAIIAKKIVSGEFYPDMRISYILQAEELDRLNGSAFGREYGMLDKNWMMMKYETPVYDDVYKDIIYTYPEQYYHAGKVKEYEIRKKFSILNPKQAPEFGHAVQRTISNWKAKKLQRMEQALVLLFQIGTKACAELCTTGRRLLWKNHTFEDIIMNVRSSVYDQLSIL